MEFLFQNCHPIILTNDHGYGFPGGVESHQDNYIYRIPIKKRFDQFVIIIGWDPFTLSICH